MAVRGGGSQHERQILARVAGQDLARAKVARRRKHRLARCELTSPDRQPTQIRAPGGQRALDVFVQLDAAPCCVDREQLARTELAAAHARVVRQRDRARLRRARHETVVGDRVAKRTQAVAVECGADDATVGEDDTGRPVPGLDQAGVVAVERAHSRIELGIVLPRGRQEHRHRVTDVAAAAGEELDGVVEHRRVRARLVEHGCRQLVAEPRLARAHPRDVAAERVDLTVVAEQPEGLSTLPRGRRVRRETLMEDRERNLERRVAQIRVERIQLIGRAERLVGDGAKRERRDVRAAHALGPSPGAIGARLGLVRTEAEGSDEHELLDPWHRRHRRVAERVAVDGHLPPTGEPDSLGLARCFDPDASCIVPKEDHREPAPWPRHERGGDRQQNARAVARLSIGGDRTAMSHPPQPLQRPVENLA